jgi:3-keto-5-aminohexanoate cleavage enzyme
LSGDAGAAARPAWAPLVVGVAPNGARKTKADHPMLPMDAAEIARAAALCREKGAALLHLHVRDRDGQHLLDAAAYREATAAVRREAGDDLIVQITTEAVNRYPRERQIAVVRETRPEACSLAIREIVPDAASEDEAWRLFRWMAQEKVHPQFILYAPDDVARFAALWKKGVVPWPHPFVLYVLGRYAPEQRSRPTDLLPFLAAADTAWHWSLCAFGALEGVCALMAAGLGGHARVGFENNLLLNDGTTAPDNAALVAQLARGAAGLGRRLATGNEARALLAAAPAA